MKNTKKKLKKNLKTGKMEFHYYNMEEKIKLEELCGYEFKSKREHRERRG
jgi:hypothetical protein